MFVFYLNDFYVYRRQFVSYTWCFWLRILFWLSMLSLDMLYFLTVLLTLFTFKVCFDLCSFKKDRSVLNWFFLNQIIFIRKSLLPLLFWYTDHIHEFLWMQNMLDYLGQLVYYHTFEYTRGDIFAFDITDSCLFCRICIGSDSLLNNGWNMMIRHRLIISFNKLTSCIISGVISSVTSSYASAWVSQISGLLLRCSFIVL